MLFSGFLHSVPPVRSKLQLFSLLPVGRGLLLVYVASICVSVSGWRGFHFSQVNTQEGMTE